jgi:SWI/SNF-related matrix-associated actin-dependent regulator 1 of chromatin subfamily A
MNAKGNSGIKERRQPRRSPHRTTSAAPAEVVSPTAGASNVKSVMFPFGSMTRTSLYAHQPRGVNWMVNRLASKGYCALRDDCGLGKTLQAILAGNDLRHGGVVERIVILCKANLATNWMEELAKFAPHLKVQSLVDAKPEARVLKRSADVYIINYELISQPARASKRTIHSVFKACDVRVNADTARLRVLLRTYKCLMVLDESHAIKNLTSCVTDSLCSLAQYARGRLLLTATMDAESPLDIYSQFFFMDGGKSFGKSWLKFQERYAVSETQEVPYRKVVKGVLRTFGVTTKSKVIGYQNLDEMRSLLHAHTLRRDKSECPDLPAKVFKRRMLSANGAHLRFLKHVRSQLLNEVDNAPDEISLAPGSSIASLLHTLERAAAAPELFDKSIRTGAKTAALLDLLDETREQVIVWCSHRNVVDAVGDALGHARVGYVCVVGALRDGLRDNLLRQFKSGQKRVLICTGDALKEGHNFQNAAHSVSFQIPWSRLTDKQSIDRTHRIGQTKTVVVERFVLRQSLDAYKLMRLKGKNAAARALEHGESRNSIVLVKEELRDALLAW